MVSQFLSKYQTEMLHALTAEMQINRHQRLLAGGVMSSQMNGGDGSPPFSHLSERQVQFAQASTDAQLQTVNSHWSATCVE